MGRKLNKYTIFLLLIMVSRNFKKESNMEKDTLYLCDRRACDVCQSANDTNPCKYTKDISHAKNFEKDGEGNYWEKDPKPLIIFQSNTILKTDLLERIRQQLKEQMASGVIACTPGIGSISIISDGTICDLTVIQEQEESK
jgi:hypothetical protein